MTNLEALRSVITYPVSDNTLLKALLDNSCSSTATYVGKTESFELAFADVLDVLATSINVSEGGYSVSVNDRATFQKMANAIRWKYGIESGSGQPVIRAKNVW